MKFLTHDSDQSAKHISDWLDQQIDVSVGKKTNGNASATLLVRIKNSGIELLSQLAEKIKIEVYSLCTKLSPQVLSNQQ